jgi:hypothetical protein
MLVLSPINKILVKEIKSVYLNYLNLFGRCLRPGFSLQSFCSFLIKRISTSILNADFTLIIIIFLARIGVIKTILIKY